MQTVESRIQDSYLAFEETGGLKMPVFYRRVTTEQGESFFIKLLTFEENGLIETGYEVVHKIDTANLIHAKGFLKKLTKTYNYNLEEQFEIFFDPETKIGFSLSRKGLNLINAEKLIKSIDDWKQMLPILGESELSPKKALQVLDNFIRRSKLFDETNLFVFLRESYKGLRAHLAAIENVGEGEIAKHLEKFSQVEKKLVTGDQQLVKQLLEMNFPLLANREENLIVAQKYVSENYNIMVNLGKYTYEEAMALPFETKKILLIGYLQSTIKAYSKEKQESMNNRLDDYYSVMLQLLKNLGFAKQNDMMINDKYLMPDPNFGKNSKDLA